MGVLWEKRKRSQMKEEDVFTTPWFNQTTLKGEKNSSLWSPITNLKVLGFESLSLKEEEENE